MSITITISGPGQTFDDEYCIIVQALKDAGITVNENNPYPPKKSARVNREILFQGSRKTKVDLIAEHHPWGG